MISILLNLLSLALWPNIWSVLESVSCAHEEKMLLGGVFYRYLLGLAGLYCCSNLLFPCWSSDLLFYRLLRVYYWSLQLLLLKCLFLPSILSILHYVFCESTRNIYVYDCHIFLVNWLFYYYRCPSLCLVTFLILKSISSDITIAIPALYGCSLHGLSISLSIYRCILL